MLAAVIDAVAYKGYASTTIGDITRRARVSRDTFYQQFASKEQCFLAAYDAITGALFEEVVAVGSSETSYVDGMRAGVRAFLAFWRDHPSAARACTVDVLSAGEEALAHRERRLGSMTRLFQNIAERAAADQPGRPNIPPVVSRAIVVAAVELTTEYVRLGRSSSLLELEDDMLYLWLMGVAGHEVAAAAIAS
jgi:AcrR family transcriptional regulator